MSIAQIAQAANVSYATAWRIINNQPCKSEEAVQAVRAAMNRMGYTPADGKRGRRRKLADGIRTHNIALLHFRAGTSISTSVLAYVQRMLAERNLNLIFGHVEDADAMPQAIRAGNVDGILGYGEFPPAAKTPSLERVPAVWMMSRYAAGAPDTWGDRVKPDHQAIGRLAADYLLGHGHRHLAYFNPNPDQGVYMERGGAFRVAAEDHAASLDLINPDGIPAAAAAAANHNELAVIEHAAEQFVERWLKLSPRPTGVFVPVDRVTLRVYRHLQKHGIQPGRDIEIVSCDNEAELLSLMHPAPQSIDLNRKAIARLAVERLFWRMRNGMSAPSIVITVSPAMAGGPVQQARASASDLTLRQATPVA